MPEMCGYGKLQSQLIAEQEAINVLFNKHSHLLNAIVTNDHDCITKLCVDRPQLLDSNYFTLSKLLFSPLKFAVESAEVSTFELLVRLGADPLEPETSIEGFATGFALMYAREDIIERLHLWKKLGESSDISPLYRAIEASEESWSSSHQKTLMYYLQCGGNIHWKEPCIHSSILHVACEKNNKVVVTACLEAKVDLESADLLKNTPLCYAAQTGSVELCKQLIDKGVRVDTQPSALWTAIESDQLECASYLKRVGVPNLSPT